MMMMMMIKTMAVKTRIRMTTMMMTIYHPQYDHDWLTIDSVPWKVVAAFPLPISSSLLSCRFMWILGVTDEGSPWLVPLPPPLKTKCRKIMQILSGCWTHLRTQEKMYFHCTLPSDLNDIYAYSMSKTLKRSIWYLVCIKLWQMGGGSNGEKLNLDKCHSKHCK